MWWSRQKCGPITGRKVNFYTYILAPGWLRSQKNASPASRGQKPTRHHPTLLLVTQPRGPIPWTHPLTPLGPEACLGPVCNKLISHGLVKMQLCAVSVTFLTLKTIAVPSVEQERRKFESGDQAIPTTSLRWPLKHLWMLQFSRRMHSSSLKMPPEVVPNY